MGKEEIKKIKNDVSYSDVKEVESKSKKELIKISEKKELIVLEDGKIFTFYGKEILGYIKSLPEDFNVFYVIENDSSLFINKDYKKIAPIVKYLLGNIYESLEMREIRGNRKVNIICFILLLLLNIVYGVISGGSIKKRIDEKCGFEKPVGVENVIGNNLGLKNNNIIGIETEKVVSGSGLINDVKGDELDTNKGGGE